MVSIRATYVVHFKYKQYIHKRPCFVNIPAEKQMFPQITDGDGKEQSETYTAPRPHAIRIQPFWVCLPTFSHVRLHPGFIQPCKQNSLTPCMLHVCFNVCIMWKRRPEPTDECYSIAGPSAPLGHMLRVTSFGLNTVRRQPEVHL